MTTAIYKQTGFAHLTDLPCIKLCFGEATAVISLYGAQVLSYQPTPDQEVLWLSPLANWHNHTPIRGGVPVCWPWFGPADKRLNPQQRPLPNHGVVRTQLWQVINEQTSAQSAGITLQITVANLPWQTDAVTLQLQLDLANSLTISLRCDSNILQQAALHSYFKINSLQHTQVQPLPKRFMDKLSAMIVDTTTSVAQFGAEVDRVYDMTPEVLNISSEGPTIEVSQQGHDASVVWNPWQEKSRQTKDLPDNSYLEFVCVETARLQLKTALPLAMSQALRCI